MNYLRHLVEKFTFCLERHPLSLQQPPQLLNLYASNIQYNLKVRRLLWRSLYRCVVEKRLSTFRNIDLAQHLAYS